MLLCSSTMGTTNPQIRVFLNLAYDYLRKRTDKNCVHLQRQLQILSVVSDLRTFEPVTSEILEFYLCLVKFLNPAEGKATVAWKVVALLTHICDSPNIRVYLRDEIKIVSLLSDFLVNSELSKDKLLRTLKLLKTVSYRVKVAHLEGWVIKVVPFLVETIVEGTSGNDSVLLALQTLANLCRSNPPVLDCLLTLSGNKRLVKRLVRMRSATMEVQLLATEMIIYMDPKKNALDLTCVDVLDLIFNIVSEGLGEGNVSWVRLAGDVFEQLVSMPAAHNILKEYKNFSVHLPLLIGGVEGGGSEPLTEALLRLLRHLADLPHQDIKALHQNMFSKALRWIHSERCGLAAVQVVRGLLATGSDTLPSACVEDLLAGLRASLKCDEEGPELSLGKLRHLILILGLVEQLCATSEALCFKLAMELEPSLFSSLLGRALTLDTTHLDCQYLVAASGKSMVDYTFTTTCGTPAITPLGSPTSESDISVLSTNDLKTSLSETLSQLVVSILTVVKGLSSIKPEYMTEYKKMVGRPEVMSHLVRCERSGVAEYVARARSITSSGCLPSECLDALVTASEEANFQNLSNSSKDPHERLLSSQSLASVITPEIEGKVDTMISQLRGTAEKMEFQIKDCALNDVMDMYEYKLASMVHREQALQEALTAAGTHNRQTNLFLLQTRLQNDHLRGLLGTWETRYNTSQAEKKAIQASITQIQDSARQHRDNFAIEMGKSERRTKEMEREVVAVRSTLEASKESVRKAQRQLSEVEEEKKTLQRRLKDERDRAQDLTGQIQKKESELHQSHRDIEELRRDVKELEKSRQQLKRESTELECLVKSHEEAMVAKEEEIEEITSKLKKMEELRRMVCDITSHEVFN